MKKRKKKINIKLKKNLFKKIIKKEKKIGLKDI